MEKKDEENKIYKKEKKKNMERGIKRWERDQETNICEMNQPNKKILATDVTIGEGSPHSAKDESWKIKDPS